MTRPATAWFVALQRNFKAQWAITPSAGATAYVKTYRALLEPDAAAFAARLIVDRACAVAARRHRREYGRNSVFNGLRTGDGWHEFCSLHKN